MQRYKKIGKNETVQMEQDTVRVAEEANEDTTKRRHKQYAIKA